MKFHEGDKVIISETAHEYHWKHIGKVGVIESIFRTKNKTKMFGVRLENLHNLSSSKGLFWFRYHSLSPYNPESTLIESEEIIMYPEFAVAEIRFLDKKETHNNAYALHDYTIEVGDKVVVSTGHSGFALAEVMSITADPLARKRVTCGREIVCKVDFTQYEVRQTNIQRAKELQAQMNAKVKDLQTLSLYELFAQTDPGMKALLDEFKSLTCPKVCETDE